MTSTGQVAGTGFAPTTKKEWGFEGRRAANQRSKLPDDQRHPFERFGVTAHPRVSRPTSFTGGGFLFVFQEPVEDGLCLIEFLFSGQQELVDLRAQFGEDLNRLESKHERSSGQRGSC